MSNNGEPFGTNTAARPGTLVVGISPEFSAPVDPLEGIRGVVDLVRAADGPPDPDIAAREWLALQQMKVSGQRGGQIASRPKAMPVPVPEPQGSSADLKTVPEQQHLAAGENPASASTAVVTSIAVQAAPGQLTINLELDANAQSAPTSYLNGWETAASQLSAAIADPITINIEVGYTEYPFNGSPEAPKSASAAPQYGGEDSYLQLRSLLLSNASPAVVAAINALPTTPSLNGVSYFNIATAEAKIWGQVAANNPAFDGFAGFGVSIPDSSIVGVALHEFTHAMGRIVGDNVLSLYRYTSVGQHDFDSTAAPYTPSYFSVDGGGDKLADFGETSDASDFLNPPDSNLTPNDPFNEFYDQSTLQSLTSVDATMLAMLGFGGGPTSSLWIVDSSGKIGAVSLATGAVNYIGNTGLILGDIAFSPAGVLYAVSGTTLFSIDTTNGAAHMIGGLNAGNGGVNALTFGGNGILYAASNATQQLYSINTATGQATALSGNLPAACYGGLVAVGNLLYMSDQNDNLDRLTISGTQVTSSVVCSLGYPAASPGFELALGPNGLLRGVVGTQVLLIDPLTGAVTPTVNFGGNVLAGANGGAMPAGTNDIVFQNAATGDTGYWLMIAGLSARWIDLGGTNNALLGPPIFLPTARRTSCFKTPAAEIPATGK